MTKQQGVSLQHPLWVPRGSKVSGKTISSALPQSMGGKTAEKFPLFPLKGKLSCERDALSWTEETALQGEIRYDGCCMQSTHRGEKQLRGSNRTYGTLRSAAPEAPTRLSPPAPTYAQTGHGGVPAAPGTGASPLLSLLSPFPPSLTLPLSS